MLNKTFSLKTKLLTISLAGVTSFTEFALAQTPEQVEAFRNAQTSTLNTKTPTQAKLTPRTPAPITQSGLPLFGETLFSTPTNYITPSDLPVPSDYVIGVGDNVEIRLFGKDNRLLQLQVDRTGSITLPDIGPITVTGLTFESMSKMLLERISKQKIGVDATISMGALRSIQILLTGDVNFPGAITTDALTSVLNALIVGGGIKPTGSMRKIEIRRQGKIVARLDLYALLLNGSNNATLRLQSGDTIFVPAVGKRVGINGSVLRPAIYELLEEKTVDDLVKLSGGFLPVAYPTLSTLDRIGEDWNRKSTTISLAKSQDRRISLKDGDLISIPSVQGISTPSERDTRFKTVNLTGAIERPGNYEWKSGIQARDLLSRFDQLNTTAYRPLAVIERIDNLTGTKKFVSLNLLDLINGKSEIPLEPYDKLIILSQNDVDYLSSANVQQVLAGRLPGAESGASAGLIVKSSAAKTDESAFKTTRKSSDLGGADEDKSAGTITAASPCPGLIELSHIVANEGSARFRSSLFSGALGSDGVHLVKSVACPGIFSSIPNLLPFLLENAVTFRGEIQNPGVIPIPSNLSFAVALAARGGLSRIADRAGIEITQQVSANASQWTLQRNFLPVTQNFDEVTLVPGQIIQVRKKSTDQESGLVRLSGEFKHPGAYEIRKGEKLSEVIARAGGLTPQAYSYGTVFLRQKIKEEKKQFYIKAAADMQSTLIFSLTRQKVATVSDPNAAGQGAAMEMINQIRNIDPVGRMVIEADPSVLQVRPELDVVMEPGDEVHVPRRSNTILVMGEVLNPGAIQFESGKRALDYIKSVGGFTRLADEDKIFAVLPNGSSEPLKLSSWNFQPTLLPPGSAIFVSREPVPTLTSDLVLLALQAFRDVAVAAASLRVISK